MQTNRGNIWVWVLVVVIVAGLGWWFYANNRGENDGGNATTTPEKVTIDLAAQNDSGITGRAELTDENGKVRVKLALTGAAGSTSSPQATTPQPAHIHIGSCPAPGAVKYPLINVVNGMSDTLLDVSLAQLKSELPLAVNVHRSAAEASVYVACGNIVMPGTMPPDDDTDEVTVVTYGDDGFSPSEITVNKGQRVRFVNESGEEMWVASAMHPTHTVYPGTDIKKCGLGAGVMPMFDMCAAGASFEFIFNEVGEWGYHNHLQTAHFGKVIVQ